VEPKRRLPLVPSAGAPPDEPPRPPWQWVGFGAAAIFVAWVPLSAAAGAVAARFAAHADGVDPARLAGAGAAIVAAYALALAAGAMAGGYVVGRWGAVGVGVREAALAGLAAASVAVAAAWASSGVAAGPLAVEAIAVPALALRLRAKEPERYAGLRTLARD